MRPQAYFKNQRAPNPPKFAQPRLSRVKVRSSPARGYKFGCVCSYMAGHYPAILMTGHKGTNTPKFVPPCWGPRRFDPTQTGLCKFGWVWSSLKELRENILGKLIRQYLRSRPPFTGVLLGPGPESGPRSAFFWAILGTCLGVPQRVLFECFLAFLGPKNAKKHSKSTLWGTPRQVPKIAQKKALRGALSGPGHKSTPVNGGRDRQAISKIEWYRNIKISSPCASGACPERRKLTN